MSQDTLCPYCGKEIASDEHFRKNLKCAEAFSDDMFHAMVPADVRQEFRMARHKHRILPSGDVEYADEYGGY